MPPINWIVVGWILAVTFGLISIPLLIKYIFRSLNQVEAVAFFFSVILTALGVGLITGG